MGIVVKSGTVLRASGDVTISKEATIVKGAKLSKSVKTSSFSTSSTAKPKEETVFRDSSGKKLSAYETAAVKATAAPATNVKTGETDYYTYTVQSNKRATTQTSNYVKPQSDVRASTKKEKRALRRARIAEKTGVSNFIESATGANRGAPNPFAETSTPAQSLGAAAGSVFTIAATATRGAKAVKVGTSAIRTVGTPVRVVGQAVVKGAPAGLKGVTGLLYTAEVGYAAGKGGYALTKATLSKESKAFINTGEAREAYEMASSQALAGKGKGAQYLISNIPGGKKIAGYDQIAFDRSVKDYALSKGYDEGAFSKAVKGYGRSRTVGTTASILAANTASEAVGGALFASSKTFTSGASIPVKGSFGNLFVQGAKVTATAGAGEGAGIALGMEASSGKSLSNINYKVVGASAAVGAVTAGTLGGAIYATSVLKPGLSKGLLGAAYASEPAELFGDIAGGSSGAGIIKTPGSITFTNTNTPVSTRTITKSSSNVKVFTSGVFSQTKVNTGVTPYAPAETIVKSNIFTGTTTQVRTPLVINTPTQTNVLVNTNTPVSTFSQTNTFVPVRTTTTKLPGFVPFGGGSNKRFKSGFGDFFKQSRSYNPSLSASVLNIKGGLPSEIGIKSGLAIRPIL